jgi:hypothetical protein
MTGGRAVLALVVIIACPMAAHASRSCLDQAEAARAWPGKPIATDGDGCWTSSKRLWDRRSAAPVGDGSTNQRASNCWGDCKRPPSPAAASLFDASSENEKSDMPKFADRIQAVEVVEYQPRQPDPVEPMVSRRNVALLIALALASVAVIEVAFGGFIGRALHGRKN